MICNDTGIVIRAHDFRETSKIAVFFTRQHGKISGMLKGIRKDPRKFSTHLGIFSENDIIFYKKRFSELHLISQCDLCRDFFVATHDPQRFAMASFCIELTDKIMPIEYPQQQLYNLLREVLTSLSEANEPRRLLYFFALKTLMLSGFKPHLESCVSCQRPLSKQTFFSNRRGGLLCTECLTPNDEGENILPGTVASILFLQKATMQSASRLNAISYVERQLAKTIFSFLSFHVERPFRTLRVLYAPFVRPEIVAGVST